MEPLANQKNGDEKYVYNVDTNEVRIPILVNILSK